MPLELRPLAKEDAQEAVALMVASYANNPFRAIMLPSGMSQISIDKTVKERQSAVTDPDKYVLKVVDTNNNDKMAGCAVWEYTKAMTDEDWEHAKVEALWAYPEARHDIADEAILKEQDLKRKIMGHTRWLGKFAPISHIPFIKIPNHQFIQRTIRPPHATVISTSRRWIYAHEVGNR